MVSSNVSLEYLFSNEKPPDYHLADEHRMLMDDLQINKHSVSFLCVLNVFISRFLLPIDFDIKRLL